MLKTKNFPMCFTDMRFLFLEPENNYIVCLAQTPAWKHHHAMGVSALLMAYLILSFEDRERKDNSPL